ncbi:3090_t:CDS:2 [Dentiscutata erythropus]|uniref:3090_t:CDS:1 n=1 Tax=Dentiscutata erythropus TaxID=1348616 RepID=A0A9N8VF16_9GLOM|nr:3090_t:CDS:2 [Dentiscutata erythropus]
MDQSNANLNNTNNLSETTYTHCGGINEFIRYVGTKLSLNATCNCCSDQKKQSSSSKNPVIESIIQDQSIYLLLESTPDSTPSEEDESLIYKMGDVKELVAAYFLDNDENECVKFSAVIELNNQFIEEALSSEKEQNNGQSFCY